MCVCVCVSQPSPPTVTETTRGSWAPPSINRQGSSIIHKHPIGLHTYRHTHTLPDREHLIILIVPNYSSSIWTLMYRRIRWPTEREHISVRTPPSSAGLSQSFFKFQKCRIEPRGPLRPPQKPRDGSPAGRHKVETPVWPPRPE